MVYGVLLNSHENKRHLMPLRQMMEVGITQLAIEKATEEDIQKLNDQVDRMEKVAKLCEGEHYEALFEEDNVFHDLVSEICRNPLSDKISRVVRSLTTSIRRQTVGTKVKTGKALELVEAHREIVRIIEKKDLTNLDQKIYHTYFLEEIVWTSPLVKE